MNPSDQWVMTGPPTLTAPVLQPGILEVSNDGTAISTGVTVADLRGEILAARTEARHQTATAGLLLVALILVIGLKPSSKP